MRSPNKDEVFEILIVQRADDISFSEAVEFIYGREVENEEIRIVDEKINDMRSGWVAMNIRARNLGTFGDSENRRKGKYGQRS